MTRRLAQLIAASVLLALSFACTSGATAVYVDRPVSPPNVKADVMLQLADLPAGFRMTEDAAETIDDVADGVDAAKEVLTQNGFASAYSRTFYLDNTTYLTSALISNETLVFKTRGGAREMLSLKLQLNAAVGAHEITLYKSLGDRSHIFIFDEREGDYDMRWVEVDFLNGNTMNTVTGKFLSGHEDALLIFDLARAQLAHQHADEPAIKKIFAAD